MKLRSTTPASISPRVSRSVSFKMRLSLVSVAVLMAAASSLQFVHLAAADQYDDQINAIQSNIDSYNAQAASLASQAQTLQTAVDALTVQENTIQAQIDLSTAKVNQLNAQIADTQKKITDDQKALGETLADLYVNGQTTPLEMIASSKNISQYLDKQTQRDSIRDSLSTTIKTITALKTQLQKQQSDAALELGNEQNSKAALVTAQTQQQNLLNQTQGQEANYQQLVKSNQIAQQKIRDEQQAAIAATFRSTGGATLIRGGQAASGGYPWDSGNCPMEGYLSTGGVDGNGTDGYGYGCRQCASYAAWRVDKETGNYPINWGNAVNFPASARASGFSTGSTPRAGSLAVMSAAQAGGPDGHVAWVEAVNSDGTITVSQYNYNYGAGWGMYSEMKLSPNAFATYIYIE